MISYQKKDGSVYSFHAGLPVFSHGETDLKSFRMFTSQLTVSGVCRQVDIVRAFGISVISMKRWVKKYREEGPELFFKTPHRLSEQLLNAIKMIVYRAETAMAMIVRTQLARSDDARSLIREILAADADIIPDEENKTLTVQLHHLTNHLSDQAARNFAANLNAAETIYPGADLRLIYKLVSDEIPPDQEV